MIRILVFSFLLSLCSVSVKAQMLGQSRAYIIKQYPTCKITKNIPDELQFNCDGLEVLYYLDENDLSIFQGMEVLTSDWNELQVALIWNNAPCATKDNVPLLSAMGSGTMKVDAIYYQQKDKVYYFFDCDLQGKKGEIKSWVYYKI